jgi:hypothetical protein
MIEGVQQRGGLRLCQQLRNDGPLLIANHLQLLVKGLAVVRGRLD